MVGGTPAYRRQFLGDDVPGSLEEFDDWICRTVLSPFSPLFREARYLPAEEADIRDTALYHSVLAAVAQGNTTRAGSRAISAVSQWTSHTRSVCWRTVICWRGRRTSSGPGSRSTASPSR
ncbi:hypothetical protein SAZ11_27655 [Streptomyces sp. FXJ1.4098]|nr:hypothetical protein [Streptomyces sp. FXJ1.4098]